MSRSNTRTAIQHGDPACLGERRAPEPERFRNLGQVHAIGPGAGELDLSTAAAGQNNFSITASNISFPPGLVLKNVTPQNIVVDLDITVRRICRCRSTGWTAAGEPDPRRSRRGPAAVEIIGGKRILENIQTIYTEKILLDRLREGAG